MRRIRAYIGKYFSRLSTLRRHPYIRALLYAQSTASICCVCFGGIASKKTASAISGTNTVRCVEIREQSLWPSTLSQAKLDSKRSCLNRRSRCCCCCSLLNPILLCPCGFVEMKQSRETELKSLCFSSVFQGGATDDGGWEERERGRDRGIRPFVSDKSNDNKQFWMPLRNFCPPPSRSFFAQTRRRPRALNDTTTIPANFVACRNFLASRSSAAFFGSPSFVVNLIFSLSASSIHPPSLS